VAPPRRDRLYSPVRVGSQPTTKSQLTQQDPDTLRRWGGWLFRHRTAIPLPIALALLLIPASAWTPALSTSLFGLGVLIVALGEAVRLWAVHHIGVISRTRSDRLGPLVDSGPFGRVRNPLYLGNTLLWLGFALSARLLWLAPVIVLLLAFEYHAIVRWEETLLTARIGESYRRYMERVPRWMPRLGAVPSRVDGDASARVFSWGETFYSERGTLIAIFVGYLLLAAKGALLRFLIPDSGF
jgi:protein-S-isoprenylcysteine O-methyltransferase Ste14